MPRGSATIDLPPPRVGDAGEGRGGWALLVVTNGRIEAELIRGLLEASGIVPVALDARDPSPSAWLFPFGNMNSPVRVFVPRSLVDPARLALLEGGFGLAEVPEPEAPSPRARLPWWVWVATALLILVFLVATLRSDVT